MQLALGDGERPFGQERAVEAAATGAEIEIRSSAAPP
jgi:hypothetical protein